MNVARDVIECRVTHTSAHAGRSTTTPVPVVGTGRKPVEIAKLYLLGSGRRRPNAALCSPVRGCLVHREGCLPGIDRLSRGDLELDPARWAPRLWATAS